MQRPPRTKGSTPPRSSAPRLSEAARHLVLPKGIVTTGWPAVRETLARLAIAFDPWQQGAAAAILGKRKDGLYAADAIALSIPRQVGKTFLVGAIVIALCLIQPKLLAVWTAHHGATAADTFRDLKAIVQQPKLKPYVKAVYDSGARLEIVFTNGSRIQFGAREHGFGRGFKKIGILVFDEAQILSARAVDDIVPAATRHPNPLIIHMGTPPKPSDPSDHFTQTRDDALSGNSTDTLYIECSADEDADPADPDQWALANPSYPVHTSARAIRRMRKNLSPESFLREALGIWDGTATQGVFAAGAWARCTGTTPAPGTVPAALGIASDIDQVWLTLGASTGGDRNHLAPVMRVRGDQVTRDTIPFASERARFVANAARIQRETGCPVVIDAKGPAEGLITDLEAAGITLTKASLEDFIQACSDIRALVELGGIEHADYPSLNAAVDAAGWRKVGDRRVFGRRSGDIDPLEAVTWALWGATKAPPVGLTPTFTFV